jgi:DivIVA domain-containing protein
MPLTPEDVSNKRFTPVRLREGYDMGEVDAFLDEVESELARLNRENSELRRKLVTAQRGGDPASAGEGEAAVEPVASTEQPDEQPGAEPAGEPAAPTPEPAETVAEAPAPAAPAAREPETIRVTTAAEASSAATRLLELATHNADQLVGEAQAEAEQILADARAEADRVQSDARARSEQLDSDTEARRAQLVGELDAERQRLDAEVEDLRSFEREYRGRLRTYFEQQLAALDGSGEDGLTERPSALGGDTTSHPA